MSEILDVTDKDRNTITSHIVAQLRRSASRSLPKKYAEEMATTSKHLSTDSRGNLRIKPDTTDELQTLQAELDIDEETIRDRQDELGLSRLHPSRREEFITEIIDDRIETRVEKELEGLAVEWETEAERQVEALFDEATEAVTITWGKHDSGQFTKCKDGDIVATVENAVTDVSDYEISGRFCDFVVVDNSTMHVKSPVGDFSVELEPASYTLHARSYEYLAKQMELVEVETRKASCTSNDKQALDIEVGRGGSDEKAHLIKLQSSNGGYSSRYTEGWTEFRDLDPEREMVLITVGQASYYNNSIRGTNERTWLVGRDGEHVWVHQVYNTHETVAEALDFMRPSDVKRLEEQGREVIRQGDVFFVEMVRSSNFEDIKRTRHDVQETDDGVVITHPEHRDLELEGDWKAVRNIDGSKSGIQFGRSTVVRD